MDDIQWIDSSKVKHVRISTSFLLLCVCENISSNKNIEKSIFYECKKITFNKFHFRQHIYMCVCLCVFVCVCVCVKLKINPRIRKCTNKETGCPEDSSDCNIHLYCKNLNLAALFSGLLQLSFVYMFIEMMRINKRHLKNVWRIQRPKHYLLSSNNKDEDNSLKNHHQANVPLFLLISTYIAFIYVRIYIFVHINIL